MLCASCCSLALVTILAVISIEIENASLEFAIALKSTHRPSCSHNTRELNHRHAIGSSAYFDHRTIPQFWCKFLVQLRKYTRLLNIFQQEDPCIAVLKDVNLELLVSRIGRLETN